MQTAVSTANGLSISLFGMFEARLNGVPLGGFDYNKVRALLAYLAVEHKQPHTRAALCALLWPDLSESAARQNLSQALTRLRQVFGDKQAEVPFLLATTDTVQLNPAAPWQVDVHTFSTLIARAERHPHRAWHLCTPCAETLQSAIGWYQGDFLAHFYLSDSVPFEEWTLPLRQRLRARMLSALERLVRYAEWRGDFAYAIEAAHRLIDLEPLHDHAHRELMRLLVLGGEQRAALAHYEHFRQLLESEVGVEPESETVALYQQIRATPDAKTLRFLAPPPSSLPTAPTPLVGRDAEIHTISERLTGVHTTRLLTVTGAPGIGKTRLALEAAWHLRFDFEAGVQWVELAPVLDAAHVPDTLAHALGVKEQPRRTVAEMVIEHLKAHHMLLVLDNFEQVLEAGPFLAKILNHCPALSLLVTSRAPLRIRAETQVTLDPLAVPDPSTPLPQLAEADAVQLFAQRAQAIQPDWQLTTELLPAVAALCRRMDGLPLAIELIAPRLKSLSATEILNQFESPLSAAPPGPRDMPLRHRTLRSAIQWSYERLTANERDLFARLGVFVGGCTLESAQAVVGDAIAVLPILEALHDASLLYTRIVEGKTRFYQLETISEFAREQLAASGEAESTISRYVDYFVRLADDAYVELLGKAQATWTAHLTAEQDNLRAALRRALDHRHLDRVLRIVTGIWRFWWQRGNLRESLYWFENGLADSEVVMPLVRSRALRAAGIVAMGLNDYPRARDLLEEAMEAAHLADSPYDHGSARTNLGMVLREQGDFDAACANLEQSAALMRTLEDPRWVKFPLMILASLYVRMGRLAEAGTFYEECLRLNRDVGDTEGTANALFGIGSVLGAQGEYGRARAWCEEGLALYQTLNHQFGMAWCYSTLGDIARRAGAYDEGLAAYQQSFHIWAERGDYVNGARMLEGIADIYVHQGNAEPAARLMGAADQICESAEVRRTEPEQKTHDEILALCRAALGDAPFEATWQAGRRLSVPEAFALVL